MSFAVLKYVLKSASVRVMSTRAVGSLSYMQSPAAGDLAGDSTSHGGLRTDRCCVCVHPLKPRNTLWLSFKLHYIGRNDKIV